MGIQVLLLVCSASLALAFIFTACSLDLLREFYAENLVDHGAFLSWLTHQMCTSNLAQANFVARIIDEYLEGMFPYRALQRPLVDGCLAKLSEVTAWYLHVKIFFTHFIFRYNLQLEVST